MSDQSYGAFRIGLVSQILSERLTPADVAQELKGAQRRFPQIDAVEIVQYERMGGSWGGAAPLTMPTGRRPVADTALEGELDLRTVMNTPEPEAMPAPELDFPPAEAN